MVIYKAENLINHKVYIGKTANALERRKWQHFNAARKGIKTIFYSALRKYGEDNFQFSVLDSCESLDDLNEREKYFIKALNCEAPKGYNMTKGGDGLAKGSVGPNKGRVWPQEMRDRISKSLTGKKQSRETNEKRSLSLKKAYQVGKKVAWNKGLTKETSHAIAVRAEKMKGRPAWNKGLKGFLKGRIAWNSGLTKQDHPSIARQADKISGLPAWNKGLTKDNDERVKKYSRKLSETMKGCVPWNKGLKMIHSEESNQKRSATMRGKKKSAETIMRMQIAQMNRRLQEKQQFNR